jgi:hypothetical protein
VLPVGSNAVRGTCKTKIYFAFATRECNNYASPATLSVGRGPVGRKPGHGCVETGNWVQIFDREVRAESYPGATVDQSAERVESFHPFWTLQEDEKQRHWGSA